MLRAIWFVPPVLTTVAEALHHVPESSHVRSCLTQSSDEQFQALVDETSDFAVTAIDNVFAWNARTPRRDFKVIAQIERTTPLRVISQPQIKAIGDLRGAELLVDSPDNGFVIALRTFLDDHGVTPGSYRLVPAGGVKQRLDALAEGRGDATLLGPPFDTTALSRGFPSLGSINAAYPDFPGQGVVARTSVIDRLSAPLGDWIAAQTVRLILGADRLRRLHRLEHLESLRRMDASHGHAIMNDEHYSLCTFSTRSGQRKAGLVLGDRVVSLARAAATCSIGLDPRACETVLGLLQDWERVEPLLLQLVETCRRAPAKLEFLALENLQLHPPVDLPHQVFCTGANYRQHVIDLTLDMGVGPEGLDKAGLRRWAENMMDERAATGAPYVFTKPVSAIAGPFDSIPVPDTTTKLDWEIELGVVIGKGGYRISREDAIAHVAGYAIVNDLTARDLIARNDYKMLGTDWLKSKGQPGFLPFGPYLVPARFIADPQKLRLKLSVSGTTMQDESTADMLFDVTRQIEYISRYVRLLPGDLICTGSPAGNGTHHGRFLQPGDVVVSEIDGLGRQRAECIASP